MSPYAPRPTLVHVIRGPIVLMVIGGLFALDHFTQYQIGQTWPVLLIVMGLFMLLGRLTRAAQLPVPVRSTPPPAPPPEYPGGAQ